MYISTYLDKEDSRRFNQHPTFFSVPDNYEEQLSDGIYTGSQWCGNRLEVINVG